MYFLIVGGYFEVTCFPRILFLGSSFTSNTLVFGAKNIGSNYPFVFTAYGIAGISGPMIGGFVRDNTGTFLMAFIPAGIVCTIGSFLALTLRFPDERRLEERRIRERRKPEAETPKEILDKRKTATRRISNDRRLEEGEPWRPVKHGKTLEIHDSDK